MAAHANPSRPPSVGALDQRGGGGIPAGELASIVLSAGRIARLEDPSDVTREAVEFARGTLGIERIGLFLVERTASGARVQGTWGTTASGRTADERGYVYALEETDLGMLRALPEQGMLWRAYAAGPDASHEERKRLRCVDRDWVAVTPLAFGQELVGLMFNDTAISRAPLDQLHQLRLALLASLLTGCMRGLLADSGATPALPGEGSAVSLLIQNVSAELQRDPSLAGKELSQRFGLTPAYLASTFKEEMGVSIVEYRNRLRLDRFFALLKKGERSLVAAALEAGFGSYSQFHRVHWREVGAAPSVPRGAPPGK